MRLRCTRDLMLTCAGLTILAGVSTAQGQWVNFQNQTGTRSVANSAIFSSDPEEKDYAYADLDQDGWTDLVIVRKTPFTSTGRRTNVLMMNEGGVLTDRTAEFATASDVPGDQGFLTPTNDRDVELVDVDGDGWLDIVTAVTLGDNLAKHISHPRIYMNLGNDGNGNWQGFRYEDARFAQLVIPPGNNQGAAPRFCSIAVGDFTGNGRPDLFFGDYDSGEAGPQLYDFNNRLYINDGNGFFTDQSTDRMNFSMLQSAFGAAGVAVDFNQDGAMDIVKQTALAAPQHIAVIYNNVNNEGFFNNYDVVYSFAPYHVSAGDLNNDTLPDLVASDDGQDRFMINQGPAGPNSEVNWNTQSFAYSGSSDQGFGSDSYVVDLDNDGWNDVIICDVDVDIPGCNRRTSIYQNLGTIPGTIPVLRETVQGGAVASIPTNMLVGTHDIAVFDINNDGWKDMVIGRCSGTQIWINQPPINIAFSFPNGRPDLIEPGTSETITVDLTVIGGEIEDGSVRLVGSVGFADDEFDITMSDLGGGTYAGDLPPGVCNQQVEYRVLAKLEGGPTFGAPGLSTYYTAIYASGVSEETDTFGSGPSPGWVVTNDAELISGAWEQGAPSGTLWFGFVAAPFEDASPDNGAFLTGIAPPGGSVTGTTVRGGATTLDSPVIDLAGSDAVISYQRWFFATNVNRTLKTFVSNDNGANWVEVASTNSTASAWEQHEFQVSDWVTPSSQVRVRFQTANPSTTGAVEAGIDDFTISSLFCEVEPSCPADLSGDGEIDSDDLGQLLGSFGSGGAGDIDGDGDTDSDDLGVLLGLFGTSCQ
ncbi:MAG: FG-GAP-like repeat-containing protein [Phycisphaerales bacterium]